MKRGKKKPQAAGKPQLQTSLLGATPHPVGMTTGHMKWELSVVILAGSGVLLVLGPNVNQMVWDRLKMPAALEMGSEFVSQTFLFISFFFLLLPGTI